MSIINGFRTTGIYDPEPQVQGPNKEAISKSIFSGIGLKKYKKELAEKAIEATVTSPQEPEQPVIEVALPPTANPEMPLTEDPEPPVKEEVLPPTANPEVSRSYHQQQTRCTNS